MKAFGRFIITVISCAIAGAVIHAAVLRVFDRADYTIGGEAFIVCGAPLIVYVGILIGRKRERMANRERMTHQRAEVLPDKPRGYMPTWR